MTRSAEAIHIGIMRGMIFETFLIISWLVNFNHLVSASVTFRPRADASRRAIALAKVAYREKSEINSAAL